MARTLQNQTNPRFVLSGLSLVKLKAPIYIFTWFSVSQKRIQHTVDFYHSDELFFARVFCQDTGWSISHIFVFLISLPRVELGSWVFRSASSFVKIGLGPIYAWLKGSFRQTAAWRTRRALGRWRERVKRARRAPRSLCTAAPQFCAYSFRGFDLNMAFVKLCMAS